jgi:lipopolysaccharide/colanic/teichoic acid biosynthesis glycosyltransferase
VHDRQEVLRRSLDLVTASVLLALSSPLWALLWLEARRRGERTIQVRETRVGMTRRVEQRRALRAAARIDRRATERRTQDLLGAPFDCSRFRTDLGPIGAWIGRRRLDKIPFLLNVIRNEMTLVGPKPEKQELVLRWQGLVPDYARRFTVLPGVTGLAQVSECADADADGVVRRVHYDLYYIDNRSLLLDVRTLGRTFGVVLHRPRRGLPEREPPAPVRTVVKGVTR